MEVPMEPNYIPSEWNKLMIAFESRVLGTKERLWILRSISFETLEELARNGNQFDSSGQCYALCALALLDTDESIAIMEDLSLTLNEKMAANLVLACLWNPERLYPIAAKFSNSKHHTLSVAVALAEIQKGVRSIDCREMHEALGFITSPNIRYHAEHVLVSVLGEEGALSFIDRHCRIET